MYILLITGCDPKIMGIGPVPAIRALLKATDKKLEDISLVEVGIVILNWPRRLLFFNIAKIV